MAAKKPRGLFAPHGLLVLLVFFRKRLIDILELSFQLSDERFLFFDLLLHLIDGALSEQSDHLILHAADLALLVRDELLLAVARIAHALTPLLMTLLVPLLQAVEIVVHRGTEFLPDLIFLLSAAGSGLLPVHAQLLHLLRVLTGVFLRIGDGACLRGEILLHRIMLCLFLMQFVIMAVARFVGW